MLMTQSIRCQQESDDNTNWMATFFNSSCRYNKIDRECHQVYPQFEAVILISIGGQHFLERA